MFLFGDSVSTEILPLAFGTVVSLPHAIKMVGSCIYQRGLIREYSCLKITVSVSFHTHTGTREVSGAYVSHRAIEYHYLEVNTWTELSFQFRPQSGVLVKVGSEVLARLFGVKKTYLNTPFEKFVED
jgi:hypothetical protein